jgi:hypothetical protein
VLVEMGLLRQRHSAVLEVMNGASVTDVARRYGVTRPRSKARPHQTVPGTEHASSPSAVTIPAGAPGASATSAGPTACAPSPAARRSATGSSSRRSAVATQPTTAGGSGPARWSCGGWTSLEG